MAEKLAGIIDDRDDNTVVRALQRLLPNLQQMDITTGVFEDSSPCTPSFLGTYPRVFQKGICAGALIHSEPALKQQRLIAKDPWR